MMFDYAVIRDGRLHACTHVNGDEHFLDVYSSMPHIDEVRFDSRQENQIVSRISAAVSELPHAEDFSLTRLHRHFVLQSGERLIERQCGPAGSPVLRPGVFRHDMDYLPASFRFMRTHVRGSPVDADNSLVIVTLEYKELSEPPGSGIDAWFTADRVRVIETAGQELDHLGLTDKFGIAIGDIPETGTVWVERTYLDDRSHRMTLEIS